LVNLLQFPGAAIDATLTRRLNLDLRRLFYQMLDLPGRRIGNRSGSAFCSGAAVKSEGAPAALVAKDWSAVGSASIVAWTDLSVAPGALAKWRIALEDC
jgi:hypothetical protein